MKATGSHISIIGHITRAELLRHLNDIEQSNGFGNRFCWFLVSRSKCIATPNGVPEDELIGLTEEVRQAVYFSRKVAEMRRDENAEKEWQSVYPALSEGKPGLVGAMISRGEAQVMRIACIYALMDQSQTIGIKHLEAALSLWEFSESSIKSIFGDLQGDPTVDRIIAGLKQGPMTETEIRDLFSRHNSADVDRALGFIFNNGIGKPEIEATGGRPRTVWNRIANRAATKETKATKGREG